MQGAASFLVLLVLSLSLAGCSDGAPESIAIEAFEATYWVPSTEYVEAHTVTVTLDGRVLYVDRFGEENIGHAVTTDHGVGTWRSSTSQTILDDELRPLRQRWCNGWAGDTLECIHDQYDWDLVFGSHPIHTDAGVATNVAVPDGATIEYADDVMHVVGKSRVFEFEDATLAPSRIIKVGPMGESVLANRTSYRPLGPLPVLPDRTSTSPPLDAVDGPLFPGANEDPYGFGFSLDDALEYLRDENADAARMLAAGACADYLRLVQRPTYDDEPIVRWNDHVTHSVHVVLTHGADTQPFMIQWGERAITREREFLRAGSTDESSRSGPFDCATRSGRVLPIPLATQMAAQLAPDEQVRSLEARWIESYGPALDYVIDVGGPQIHVNATAGQLSYLQHVPMGQSIDS